MILTINPIKSRFLSRSPYPLIFALVMTPMLCSGIALSDEPTSILKPDIPRLDTSSPKQHPDTTLRDKTKTFLQGQIEQTESLKHEGQVSTERNSQPDNQLRAGKVNIDKQKRLKAITKQNTLDAQIQSGIGIIGVKFVIGFGGPPTINRVFPGTPAWRLGLKPNDIIVAVDGIPTLGLTKEEVYDMIVGIPNTPVTVSVRRRSDFQALTMNRMDFNDITDPLIRRDYLMSR